MLAATIDYGEPGKIYYYTVTGLGGNFAMPEVASCVLSQRSNGLKVEFNESFWNRPNSGPDKSDQGGGVDLGDPPTHRFQSRRIADQLKDETTDRDIVVLLGYSLGGNMVLEAGMKAYYRDIEIDVLATIDPVATNQPGFRAPLNFQLQVHENVRHYFNRWQDPYPWPVDLGTSGDINYVSRDTVNDQGSANEDRAADESRKRRGCTALHILKSNYTTVSDHERIANDDYTEAELIRVIESFIPERHPVISVTGNERYQLDSETQRLEWEVEGHVSATNLTVREILPNGSRVVIHQESTRDQSGFIDFNDLVSPVGNSTIRLEFEIEADGFLSTSWKQEIEVGDEDRSVLSVSAAGSSGQIYDSVNREFKWSISDPSGLSHSSAEVRGPGVLLHRSTNPDGVFSLNSYGPGYYSIKAFGQDADSDWPGDPMPADLNGEWRFQTAQDGVTVLDDDEESPDIRFFDQANDPLFGFDSNESHGLDSVIAREVQDESGVSAVMATLRKDGDLIRSWAVDATGSVSLNPYGIGAFELILEAADGDVDG